MDAKDIIKDLGDKYLQDIKIKQYLLKAAELGVRFYVGDQYIQYNKATQHIEPIVFSEMFKRIPKVVTNIFASEIDSVVALFTRNNPIPIVTPNSSTYDDLQAANLAENLLRYKGDKDKEWRNYQIAVKWAALTGTVFREDYWDVTTKTRIRVPKYKEVDKPIEDVNGNFLQDEQGNVRTTTVIEEELDADGCVVYEELPLGDVGSDIKTIWEISVDPLAINSIEDGRWIMESSLQDIDWVHQQYAKSNGEGYTGATILPVDAGELTQTPLDALNRLKSATRSGTTARGELANMCVLHKYYEAPSSEHPRGKMIVIANGAILFQGDSPYIDCGIWHPYTMWRWKTVPGRFWGSPLAQDLISLQRRLNGIDSLLSYHRTVSAVTQKMVAKSAGIKKGEITGEPGQVYFVNMSPTGLPPIQNIEPGRLDPGVFEERKQIIEDMSRISASLDTYRMQKTSHVTAIEYSGTVDAGYNKIAPLLKDWEDFIAQSEMKKLKIIAEKYREPRDEILMEMQAYFRNDRKNARFMAKLKSFTGEDIRGNFNVTIEAGSTLPKSKAAEQETLLQVLPMGLLGDIQNDPFARDKVLHKLGIYDFDSDVSKDLERAYWENDSMINGVAPEMLQMDIHPVHMKVMEEVMKSPSWYDLPTETRALFAEHYQGHAQAQQQAQQAQMQQQMMMMTAVENVRAQASLTKEKLKGAIDLKKEAEWLEYQQQKDALDRAAALQVQQYEHAGGVVRDAINKSGGQ